MTQLYKITNNINNKYYIGVHSGDIFTDNYWGSGTAIKLAIKKYGKEKFTREVIGEYYDKHLAYWMERALVGEELVDNTMCYNLTEGGNCPPVLKGDNHPKYWLGISGEDNPLLGRKLTKEHKRKLSESKKGTMNGSDNHFYQKKHSDESKKQMSLSTKEWYKNNEHPKGMKNKTHSDETKRKISESTKKSLRKSIGKPVIRVSDGKQYNSIVEAVDDNDISPNGMKYHISGKAKIQKFKYIQE